MQYTFKRPNSALKHDDNSKPKQGASLLNETASVLFYGLLRIALWADRDDAVRNEVAMLEQYSYSQSDWGSVSKFALEQTVMGLLDMAIEKLPQSLWPPRNVRMQMFMHGNRIKQMHILLNRSLYGMTQKLNAANIHSVLLKGQGIAQDYVVPVTRQCGDLDIWVGNDVYQDVCDAIQKEGYSADYAVARVAKHLNFTYEKSTVEIHRYSAKLNYAHKNKAFHAWTDECLKSTQRCMWVSSKDWKASREQSDDAVKILLPQATYNALYIFLHLYHHFIYGGVGFRQLCDWCRCIYVHYSEIDQVELEARLKDSNYTILGRFSVLCALKS
jgi:hypothetical protein